MIKRESFSRVIITACAVIVAACAVVFTVSRLYSPDKARHSSKASSYSVNLKRPETTQQFQSEFNSLIIGDKISSFSFRTDSGSNSDTYTFQNSAGTYIEVDTVVGSKIIKQIVLLTHNLDTATGSPNIDFSETAQTIALMLNPKSDPVSLIKALGLLDAIPKQIQFTDVEDIHYNLSIIPPTRTDSGLAMLIMSKA